MFSILLKGYTITFSLIVAIGIQNIFVLKQALKQKFIMPIVIICISIDIFLISIGVFGFGYIIKDNPFTLKIISFLGIVFLVSYSFISFYWAIKGKVFDDDKKEENKSLKQIIIFLLLITLLNPHVYLDTVLLIGSVGAIYETTQEKLLYILGALLASSSWFILLGYGSKYLIPLFKKKVVWRIIDLLIALIMLSIAYSLVPYLYK